MNGPTTNELNKSYNYDMATVSRSIGEFEGDGKTNVAEWLDGVVVISQLVGLNEAEMIKCTILALRGVAKEWGVQYVKTGACVSWVGLKNEMVNRFSDHKKSDEILNRFLCTPEVNSYEKYLLLLKDAKLIIAARGVSKEHAMRQVIARSPAGLKSLLLQVASQGVEWEEFLRQAESAAWVVFPERIIGRVIEDHQEAEIGLIKKYTREKEKFKRFNNNFKGVEGERMWFCHIHGKGDHSTKFCKVVKLLESKGWTRNKNKNGIRSVNENFNEENEINSNDSYLSKRSKKQIRRNPFFVNGNINGRPAQMIIDTGADVSLIDKKTYNLCGLNGMQNTKTKLKSASGNSIEVLGEMKNVEMEIEGKNIITDAIITKSEPNGYAIIGADAFMRNKDKINEIITRILWSSDKDRKRIKWIRETAISGVEEAYSHLFKTELNEMTKCKLGVHLIKTEGFPVVQKNVRVPKLWEYEIDKEIEKLKKSGIIRDSKSPWASSIVPVRKKSGEMRLCIDFRKVNKITLRDNYPLPRIDEIIEDLASAKVFSILDATSGYYQIEIAEEDKEKTAFRWKSGFYEFNRMPFGLCNAPSTFQRVMDEMFLGISGKFVVPYLDDIIVFSESKESHIKHLEEVFKRIEMGGLVLNKAKCKFFKEELNILGHVISNGIVKPDKTKIEAINNFKRPENIRQLRSFLGLINYCRGFIPNLANLEKEMNLMLKGESKRSCRIIIWNKQQNDAFLKLKRILCESTMRAQPNFNKSFILTTDASESAIGGILSQVDNDGTEKLIYAYSKTLDGTQQNYSVTDKELLAVIKSIQYFRRYLLGRKFLLRTDHQAISYIKEAKNPTSRLLRWGLILQEYDFNVEYIKGEKNGADGLSRYCSNKIESTIRNIDSSIENKNSILKSYHEISGHGTKNTMMFLMRNKFNWPNMARDIQIYVRDCDVCAEAGSILSNTKNRMIKIDKPNELWECDLIGRIPSENGNKFIFVAVDHYTKWVVASVINDKSAESIKECIVNLIIKKFGKPKILLTDNGKEFISKVCKTMALELGIEWKYASPYHHKTTGLVERTNQTLWRKLKKLSKFGQLPWEKYVNKAVYSINISPQRSIGTSPWIMKNLHDPVFNFEKKYTNKVPETYKREELEKIRKKIHEKYMKEITKGVWKAKYDFKYGDPVYLYVETPSNKLSQRWKKGYKVTALVEPDAVIVSDGKSYFRVNKTRVKLNFKEKERECRNN
ncbi:MAG: reverse transcriptase domain-containing protein [Aeromonas sp.]